MQGKPAVHITGPHRTVVRSSVVPAKSGNDGEYEITFTPDVIGTYDIDVVWNGKHIPGRKRYNLCITVTFVGVNIFGIGREKLEIESYKNTYPSPIGKSQPRAINYLIIFACMYLEMLKIELKCKDELRKLLIQHAKE